LKSFTTLAVIAVSVGAVAGLAWRYTRPVPPPPWSRPAPVGPHEGRVTALLVDPTVTSGDLAGRIVVWDAAGGVERTWVAHDGALRTLLRGETPGTLVSVGADTAARWDAHSDVQGRYRLPDQQLNDGAVVAGGIGVVGIRGAVALLGPDGPRWQSRGIHGAGAVAALATPTRLITGGADGRVLAWDPALGQHTQVWSPAVGVVVALVPAEDRTPPVEGVLAVGLLGLARCDAQGVTALGPIGGQPTSAALAGDVLAIGTEGGTVELHNPSDGKLIRTIDTGDPVLTVALSVGRLYTGGGADGRVRIWQVNNGAALGTLPPEPPESRP